jgi:outer membrane protein assembly factor BamB
VFLKGLLMSVPELVAPPRKRVLLHVWFPTLILISGSAALAVIQFGPFPEWEQANRNVSTMFTAVITSALLLLWFIFCSGVRWILRLAVVLIVALAVGGTLASVRDVRFTGDMFPILQFRWESPQGVSEWHTEKTTWVAPSPIELADHPGFDFPEYRGRNRDGAIVIPVWLPEIPKRGYKQADWRHYVGGGYSGFVVVGNVAVTLQQRGENEAVVCYDRYTGGERWQYVYPAHFSERLGGDGPRATPTIYQGDIFSLGATGMLVCLNGSTGDPKWSVNILERNRNVTWGMAGSPLVYDEVVVVNRGAQTEAASGTALIAYDRRTGKPVWSAGSRRAGYSSPMLAMLGGMRQILLLDGEALAGFDSKTGKELWQFKWDETLNGINVAQPLVLDDDRVFISSGYGIGCALVQVTRSADKWSAKQLWKNKAMRCRFSSPVAYQDFIYGLDEGFLVCLDPKTGQRKWRQGRFGHGQMLRCGGQLAILSETGEMVVLEANAQGYRELGRFQALEGKTWNYPCLAHGMLFVRNHLEMACYNVKFRMGFLGDDW